MEDSTIRKRKKEIDVFKCSRCHTIITYEGDPGQKIKVECPNCGKKGNIKISFKKPKKTIPLTKNKAKDKNLSKEKNQKQNNENIVKKTRLQLLEEITLNKIIWTLTSFFITVIIVLLFFVTVTGKLYIDTLFVSIFIGIAVLKELTDEFIPDHLKKKLNLFISGFIIIFLLIVLNEIISLISK